jgi:hypothetical protein
MRMESWDLAQGLGLIEQDFGLRILRLELGVEGLGLGVRGWPR